ncbi:MAG: OmpA family protein [Rubrivivax sp.]|nr:OmpA family protein [Rubrivivax sp.]
MSGSATTVAGASRGAVRTTPSGRFARVAGGASPFVWGGLLPLLGLSALVWFSTTRFALHEVQATVAREMRSALVHADMAWVDVAVSGQEVWLSGTPPRAGAGDDALAVARTATCPTWAGPLTCAVTVIGAFGPSVPALPTPPPATGVAPSALPVPLAAATACEAAFASLLARSRVEFTSGGAAIDARSAKLLDQLAGTARICPGRILVEGHTDDVGTADANQHLSEARAAAVRDALLQRGIPATQLEALGYGQMRPLADNGNEAGRAANRRIEFKALP